MANENKRSYQGSHGGSIFSRRKQKMGAKKDAGSGPSKIRRVFAQVRCDVHGRMTIKGIEGKFVKVPVPRTRTQRFHLGCPFCRAEQS